MLLSEGLTAYRELEYAAAAQLLRRATAPEARPALGTADRQRALMYLGASELLGGDRNAAVETFRSLLLENPRFRPDSLVFPPRVTGVVAEVTQTTKAVAVVAPPERTFRAGERGFALQVYATSPHLIRATLRRSRSTVRTLYNGDISDNVTIPWDGLSSNGGPVDAGSYVVEIASMVSAGSVLRSVRLPVEVRSEMVDTLPWPPEPPGRRFIDLRFLIPGVVVGGALALPALLGDVSGEGARIGLGFAAFGIGAVGSFRQGNGVARGEWSREVDRIRAENPQRRSRPRMVVRAGAAERVEGGGR